jgi:hypothetical protein
VVWSGVVWCGVVWCGVVWCGVVWCGLCWVELCVALSLRCVLGGARRRVGGWHCVHASRLRSAVRAATDARRHGCAPPHARGPRASCARRRRTCFDARLERLCFHLERLPHAKPPHVHDLACVRRVASDSTVCECVCVTEIKRV